MPETEFSTVAELRSVPDGAAADAPLDAGPSRGTRPKNRGGRPKKKTRSTASGLSSLTNQQRRVYDFIRDTIRTSGGKSPTLRDIAEAMGFRSINGVMCHLRALARKGVIAREDGQARGICISTAEPIRAVRFGDSVVLDCGDRVYELDVASAARLGQALLVQAGVALDLTRK